MSDSIEAVKGAITRRILNRHLDLLGKYGPEAVTDAIDEIANFAGSGGLDEIGSSDVSGWVADVERRLAALPANNESLAKKLVAQLISAPLS